MLVEAPEWEPIERELVVVLLARNIFWRTADVRNYCKLRIFFDWWITTIKWENDWKRCFRSSTFIISDERATLQKKWRNLPTNITNMGIQDGRRRWYWNLTRKRKTKKSEILQFKSKIKVQVADLFAPLPSPDSVTCNQAPANSPFCATWQKKELSFWEEEHIYLEDLLESRLWKEHTQPIWACPRLAIPVEETFPAYWFITDWTGNAFFYSLPPSEKPWLSSCTESLGRYRGNRRGWKNYWK